MESSTSKGEEERSTDYKLSCRTDDLLHDLFEAIEEVNRALPRDGAGLGLGSSEVSFLLSCLEQVVSHELRQKGLIQSQQLFFWEYAQNLPDCLPEGQAILDEFNQLRSVRTKTGAGRVFLCRGLNHKELSITLAALMYNEPLTK